MIGWIDITSPALRNIFQEWCGFRHNKIVPDVGDYNDFSVNIPQQNLISVVVPRTRSEAYFRFIGSFGHRMAPRASSKLRLDQITPLPDRLATANPFYRAIRAGQPYCRRAEYDRGNNRRQFEQLVLPFADRAGRVCLVDAVFVDIGT